MILIRRVSRGSCSYIHMSIQLQRYRTFILCFYNIILKIKHKLYTTSSSPPPRLQKCWVLTWYQEYFYIVPGILYLFSLMLLIFLIWSHSQCIIVLLLYNKQSRVCSWFGSQSQCTFQSTFWKWKHESCPFWPLPKRVSSGGFQPTVKRRFDSRYEHWAHKSLLQIQIYKIYNFPSQ
jgi:hypothetical protein